MSSTTTLDRLWQTLGLDELPADAGSAESLGSTRRGDWNDATVPASSKTELTAVPTERVDLPRISLTPPHSGHGAPPVSDELTVTGVLGQGGMGRVLLAHQASLGRDVAVKVPRTDASGGTIGALVHEAQMNGAVEHPGVIPVYSLASDAEGRPALVMKRVDGVSWSVLIRHPEDPAWNRVASPGAERVDSHVEILRQVCNAIAFAHQKGVLHRDLKPSNVLIGEFGEVYVADWGIATRKPEPGEKRKPALVGSPLYLAPEMVTGDDAEMDERTDVFLLGSTLYEILTGRPPWQGPDLRSVLEDAWRCKAAPPPPSAPAELVSICGRAMAFDKAARFQSVLEFREALGGFLRHRGSVHLAEATTERLKQLKATLTSGTRTDSIYPLLSECRFGFTQALREWPDNDVARRGLNDCIEATARFEMDRGNLASARALLGELEAVPQALHERLSLLERKANEVQKNVARVEHLSNEMDPRVAQRQRAAVFFSTVAAILAVVVVPMTIPGLNDRLRALGGWYLAGSMAAVLAFFGAAVFIGRRSILSTRLNRRLIGMVASAGIAVFVDRIVCALLGMSLRDTLLNNCVMVLMVCVTGGITVHWGFYWSAAAMALGLVAAYLLPGSELLLFAGATMGALIFAVLSWRGWQGEIRVNRES